MERGRLRRLRRWHCQVEAENGPIDIVVANAGITRDAISTG
jgi:NAD(P)-dependent dehydrogenase (short-subunit alcohol dehydrogenase family)